ncbi:hypothetical protein CLAFUW4_10265 [Fulvia fulva]|uniref:Uncharacterized protein n=1 Tax=Passalora fulva TaxID=5499 RepID=A0A9Q8LF67_PASFU|nr:uncharacterized protein CLAFUR5_04879 [Fulvia fulva]KAK4615938.1 hypothetical protein CLAFUR4_10269 [Fulvia fulva]KAK4617035.1 hypothetical protein CLAFUR0_10267 [Fulvia fulva]UJO16285.1 hypothetical protein CLAFUR5_04879 [Fulvia fulva]WPV19240.1 hypothetical protein CLAFUW4_10265 [Fulvia fulva]WPV34162.1 hypothetical protein CLAFUW7_10265 [Fulvia fulva]
MADRNRQPRSRDYLKGATKMKRRRVTSSGSSQQEDEAHLIPRSNGASSTARGQISLRDYNFAPGQTFAPDKIFAPINMTNLPSSSEMATTVFRREHSFVHPSADHNAPLQRSLSSFTGSRQSGSLAPRFQAFEEQQELCAGGITLDSLQQIQSQGSADMGFSGSVPGVWTTFATEPPAVSPYRQPESSWLQTQADLRRANLLNTSTYWQPTTKASIQRQLDTPPKGLLDLPPELRNNIYDFVFTLSPTSARVNIYEAAPPLSTDLLFTSHQIHNEALHSYRKAYKAWWLNTSFIVDTRDDAINETHHRAIEELAYDDLQHARHLEVITSKERSFVLVDARGVCKISGRNLITTVPASNREEWIVPYMPDGKDWSVRDRIHYSEVSAWKQCNERGFRVLPVSDQIRYLVERYGG